MRKDLNMRKGKIAAQASHASMKVFLDLCFHFQPLPYVKILKFRYNSDSAWDNWLNGLFTKIVVSCDSESELVELYEKAKEKKLPCSLIIDAGLTEFNGVPTKTCIAIGPAFPEEVDEITNHIKLY